MGCSSCKIFRTTTSGTIFSIYPENLQDLKSKMPVDDIRYSEKYCDDLYEYRHVLLPIDIAKLVPRSHLMTETEWRNIGVQQSPGWVHYMLHEPEPQVLLFRRPRPPEEDKNNYAQGI